ncbi:response regulator transcription factor [Verrucomicrobiales bacterium]|nr:response regulator transcription factor [Verrucomicrobiales bacterium]
MPTILIVDDEEDIRDLISMNLHREKDYTVIEAADGLEALTAAKEQSPDLIVLDLMLPGMDGLNVCKNLKEGTKTKSIPVIMLTAKGRLEERIDGLALGADDYLSKPFSPKELMLRIRNLVHRSNSNQGSDVIAIGPFTLDKNVLKLALEGEEIDLTSTEFKLLLCLIESPGVTQERADLLKRVWGYNDMIQTRTLDTHIKRLREKLGDYGPMIETSRGIGYRFCES